jgi:hypothetical protein
MCGGGGESGGVRFIVIGFELAVEGLRGNDLSNHTKIISIEESSQGCKQTDQELVPFGRKSHGESIE